MNRNRDRSIADVLVVNSRVMPPASADTILERARAALRHAAALGVTTLQDMTASALECDAYQTLCESGELTARISSMQNYDGPRAVIRGESARQRNWLTHGGRKFFADGSMGATTAFFEPYADDPGTSGLLIHEPDRLDSPIFETDADGVQPVVHAIGDRANTLVLDIFASARGARHQPRVAAAHRTRAGRQD